MLNAAKPAECSPGREEILTKNYFSFAGTPLSLAQAWREADTKSSGKRSIREGGQNPPGILVRRRERGNLSDLDAVQEGWEGREGQPGAARAQLKLKTPQLQLCLPARCHQPSLAGIGT